MDEYITIKQSCEILQVIKKSKFYCRLFPVKSADEAQEIISSCKKTYWDASHNCSAFVVGRNGEITRSSDDGEPQGTAGVPMLEVLKRENVTDVLAVCTRYFGGTLLGASGLIRAYSSSVAEALKEATLITFREMDLYSIDVPFSLYGKVEYYLNTSGLLVEDISYGAEVNIRVYTDEKEGEALKKKIQEISSGTIGPVFLSRQFIETEV